jgi:hypothetical protein
MVSGGVIDQLFGGEDAMIRHNREQMRVENERRARIQSAAYGLQPDLASGRNITQPNVQLYLDNLGVLGTGLTTRSQNIGNPMTGPNARFDSSIFGIANPALTERLQQDAAALGTNFDLQSSLLQYQRDAAERAGLGSGINAAEYQGAAAGMLVTGGTPGVDSVPIMAQEGERVLSRAQNRALELAGWQFMANGGVVLPWTELGWNSGTDSAGRRFHFGNMTGPGANGEFAMPLDVMLGGGLPALPERGPGFDYPTLPSVTSPAPPSSPVPFLRYFAEHPEQAPGPVQHDWSARLVGARGSASRASATTPARQARAERRIYRGDLVIPASPHDRKIPLQWIADALTQADRNGARIVPATVIRPVNRA